MRDLKEEHELPSEDTNPARYLTRKKANMKPSNDNQLMANHVSNRESSVEIRCLEYHSLKDLYRQRGIAYVIA